MSCGRRLARSTNGRSSLRPAGILSSEVYHIVAPYQIILAETVRTCGNTLSAKMAASNRGRRRIPLRDDRSPRVRGPDHGRCHLIANLGRATPSLSGLPRGLASGTLVSIGRCALPLVRPPALARRHARLGPAQRESGDEILPRRLRCPSRVGFRGPGGPSRGKRRTAEASEGAGDRLGRGLGRLDGRLVLR